MVGRNTIVKFVLLITLLAGARLVRSQMNDGTSPPQVSGTVVDSSGAVIAGAAVQIRSMDHTAQRTTQIGQEWFLQCFWTSGR